MRTLCLVDEPNPIFSLSYLERMGWGFYSKPLPNGELVGFKGDMIGFFKPSTGHFISCKNNERFEILIEEQIRTAESYAFSHQKPSLHDKCCLWEEF